MFILFFFVFAIGFLMWLFVRSTPKEELVGYPAGNIKTTEEEAEKGETGFMEGLKLLFTHGYLLGIFFIIAFYELIVTILDNHFKITTFESFSSEAEVGAFLSSYATWTGIVASTCVLLGINNIQRKLGMRASLITLPLLVICAVLVIWINPYSLTYAFIIMVASKAVNYALNQPTMKQLYIPTTKDTKYKAQAWIEMFGSRSSKGGGAFVATFRDNFTTIAAYLTMTSVLSFGLIGLWILIAIFVSGKFNKAIKDDTVVC